MLRIMCCVLMLLFCNVVSANDQGIALDEVQAAVERLVARSNYDAFLVVEESETRKFVQFSHNPDTGMAFDLPVDGLSDEERMRASLHLINAGAEFLSWQEGEYSGHTYSKQLQQDVEAAVSLVAIVMRDVYEFGPDARYSLVEN